MNNKSKVIKSDHFSWDGIPRKEYKKNSASFKDVHRYTLLGPDIPELNFETRYFEIQPGGYSSLELHRHPHSAIILRGSGTLILEDETHDLKKHDVVYVAPETIHQFQADDNEPLGFICIVDRYRDRPVIPDNERINNTIKSEDIRKKIKK